MPQPLLDTPSLYRDPHKKQLCHFSTERNDGILNGGCPFSILLNLNNVDDKIIVPQWLAKSPKVYWDCEGEKRINVVLNFTSNGDMAAEYVTKYMTKGIPKRGAKGDAFWWV